jgi:hypothetical protein
MLERIEQTKYGAVGRSGRHPRNQHAAARSRLRTPQGAGVMSAAAYITQFAGQTSG